MVGGRDVTDEPLEIGAEDIGAILLVFTDRPTQLSGTVRNAQNEPDQDADVVIFPADRQRWKPGQQSRRARSTRTSTSGSYSISGPAARRAPPRRGRGDVHA